MVLTGEHEVGHQPTAVPCRFKASHLAQKRRWAGREVIPADLHRGDNVWINKPEILQP